MWLKRALALGLLATLGLYSRDQGREIPQPNGVIAPAEPRQLNMAHQLSQRVVGYDMTPQARFSLEARVLSRERYYLGREAKLAPIDLALGWGPMSSNDVLEHIDIRQRGRYYFWSSSKAIPRGKIARHSANMHMIPSTEAIADELKRVRRGHLVELSGYLVDVRADDGWT